jgi:uncharacterized membrane protein
MKAAERFFSFLMGFFIYSLIEIAARGYTHWTMALTGGLVLSILYDINSRDAVSLFKSCIAGMIIITFIEFTVGVAVNLILKWQVWDYSDMPLNVLGQICLPFSALWFLLCIPAYYLCKIIKNRFSPQIQ